VIETDASLDGLRVLVVDDNEDTRVIFEAIFTHMGAVVFTAKGGSDALTIAATGRPHVIVSDLSRGWTAGSSCAGCDEMTR